MQISSSLQGSNDTSKHLIKYTGDSLNGITIIIITLKIFPIITFKHFLIIVTCILLCILLLFLYVLCAYRGNLVLNSLLAPSDCCWLISPGHISKSLQVSISSSMIISVRWGHNRVDCWRIVVENRGEESYQSGEEKNGHRDVLFWALVARTYLLYYV